MSQIALRLVPIYLLQSTSTSFEETENRQPEARMLRVDVLPPRQVTREQIVDSEL
jgi:hypothetical protein